MSSDGVRRENIPISRFPIPKVSSLPQEMRDRLNEVDEKVDTFKLAAKLAISPVLNAHSAPHSVGWKLSIQGIVFYYYHF